MPNNTTRTYERVNKPGATRSGKDDVMSRLLMGGNVQQAEGAALGEDRIMPAYCYRDSKDNLIERVFPMGKAPGIIDLPNGDRAARSLGDEYVSIPASTSCWPMECVASGVNAEQSGGASRLFGKEGCSDRGHEGWQPGLSEQVPP